MNRCFYSAPRLILSLRYLLWKGPNQNIDHIIPVSEDKPPPKKWFFVEIGKDNGYLTLLVFNIISLANDVTWVWQDNKGVNVVPEYCVNLENLRGAFR